MSLANSRVSIVLDHLRPRILWFDGPGGTRILGEPLATGPRLYVHRKRDRAVLTTDSPGVEAAYSLAVAGTRAVYHGRVTCDGRPAAEFDVALTLAGRDLTVVLEKVKEFPGYCFLSLRLAHLASAASTDDDSRALTCYGQGRVLDPRTCAPTLVDYNWHGAIARMSAAVYRPRFMAVLDIPGYDDLFIVDVWQYSRPADGPTYASVGTELMHRQRPVEDPRRKFELVPPHVKFPLQITPGDPIVCARRKTLRLHFIAAAKGCALDWTDAALYLQTLTPKRAGCHPLYRNAMVYKTTFPREVPGGYSAALSFVDGEQILHRLHHITDGMKQVCYFTAFQHNMGDSGWPWPFTIHPEAGDKATLKRIIKDASRWNAIVSFHGNFDVFSDDSPNFDSRCVARDASGHPQSQGRWGCRQLYLISMPKYLAAFRKLIPRLLREYGLHDTLHLDTFSGGTYSYDADPRQPHNAADFMKARRAIVHEFRRHGVDITSECLVDPYVGWIGHVWALFNGDTTWHGEVPVPLANFIYHGVISWNSGKATDEKGILESLIQGGGSGMEFPFWSSDWTEVVDSLYLIHIPYLMLRNRRWTGYRADGAVRRVNYGPGSRITVDDAKPGYEVVVDGQRIARDFVTVFRGWRKGTLLAFSRNDTALDWPAPAGWRNGPLPAVALTENGPGVRPPARVERGRLRLDLRAHQPVRLGPV
jgi:hypothetical protein